jgi:hypothetical protein
MYAEDEVLDFLSDAEQLYSDGADLWEHAKALLDTSSKVSWTSYVGSVGGAIGAASGILDVVTGGMLLPL